jgi:hypothetical protein
MENNDLNKRLKLKAIMLKLTATARSFKFFFISLKTLNLL